MAIKKLQKVYCGLNLGYIYNLSYSYVPQVGVSISLFFVNETGVYNTGFLKPSPSKTQIKIGNASFSMYPIRAEKSSSADSKTIRVDFVDETYKLENYYVALTGRGCGEGVYQLGESVDPRTEAEKSREDPDLYKIRKFTTFDDIEYTFDEFLAVLKKVFSVDSLVSTPEDVTRSFSGTFKSVLDSWCSYLGYVYFFEAGILKIFDPRTITVTFPSVPSDAIDSTESESIENTYGTTAWNYFYDEGGEVSIDAGDDFLVTNQTFLSHNDYLSVKETQPKVAKELDIGQLIAAQYGIEFWLIYNISKGTAEEVCGYTILQNGTDPDASSDFNLSARLEEWKSGLPTSKAYDLASLDVKKFQDLYLFYKQYGDKIQGRLYISDITYSNLSNWEWFDTGNTVSVPASGLDKYPRVQLEYFSKKQSNDYSTIPDTFINSSYQGVILNDNRYYFFDNYQRPNDYFKLNDIEASAIKYYFENYTSGLFGNNAIDYGANGKRYILHQRYQTFDNLGTLIGFVDNNNLAKDYFKNKQIVNLRGRRNNNDIDNDKYSDSVDIQFTSIGNVSSNVSTIKAFANSNLVAYYAKFEDCKSLSTNTDSFKRRFLPRNISNDIPIRIEKSVRNNGTTSINRDFRHLESLSNSRILSVLAKSYNRPKRTLSFTLNYFDPNISSSFMTDGLIGISISIQEGGMMVSYEFSDEILDIPVSESELDAIDRSIKNSWISKYNPARRFQ